jgi:hypothetical protein
MNFDELLDDEFCEPPKGVFDNVENIFPIIGCECNIVDDFSLGTGFFINETGYFLTAAHVLKNKKRSYKALINDEKYDFEVVYIEYIVSSKQVPPICRDLAICKISNFKKDISISYLFNSDFLVNQTVFFSGYRLINTPCKIDELEVLGKKFVYLYKLKSKDLKHESAIRITSISGNDILDNRLICSNTRSLNIEELHGMSGGPVYYEKSVFGMLIGDCYILSEYIVEKLNELKIDYKSDSNSINI